MNLAYKKILGKFTKVLGFGKTPPPGWEKFPNDIVFFLRAYLIRTLYLLFDAILILMGLSPQARKGDKRVQGEERV